MAMRSSKFIIVGVVLILAVAVIGALYVMTRENDRSSPYLSADLEYGEAIWAVPDASGHFQDDVEVEVWGNITNNGTEDLVAIVHLKIFDGNSWYSYSENVGVVPAGGKIHFEWSKRFGVEADANAVIVEYSVSRG